MVTKAEENPGYTLPPFDASSMATIASDLEKVLHQNKAIVNAAEGFAFASQVLSQIEAINADLAKKRAEMYEIEINFVRTRQAQADAEEAARKAVDDAKAEASAIVEEARRNANEKVMDADKRVTALMGAYQEQMAVLAKDHEENTANRAQQIKDQTAQLADLTKSIADAKFELSTLITSINAAKKRALEDLGIKVEGAAISDESSGFTKP